MRRYNKTKEMYYNMPLADLLLVIFIVLKLTGVIDWSWWWVLSPLWIWWLIALAIMAIAFVVAVVNNWIIKRKMRR